MCLKVSMAVIGKTCSSRANAHDADVALYMFLQRYIISGLTSGAIKG